MDWVKKFQLVIKDKFALTVRKSCNKRGQILKFGGMPKSKFIEAKDFIV